MQCELMQERISNLLDHDVSVAEAQTVFAHLGACPECAVFYSQASLIGRRMRRLSGAEYPMALDERIYNTAGIRRGDTAPAHRTGRRRRAAYLPDSLRSLVGRRLVLPVPAAIAAFIACLGLSIFLLRSVAPGLLPVEKETKIVVAYPPVEVIADEPLMN